MHIVKSYWPIDKFLVLAAKQTILRNCTCVKISNIVIRKEVPTAKTTVISLHHEFVYSTFIVIVKKVPVAKM